MAQPAPMAVDNNQEERPVIGSPPKRGSYVRLSSGVKFLIAQQAVRDGINAALADNTSVNLSYSTVARWASSYRQFQRKYSMYTSMYTLHALLIFSCSSKSISIIRFLQIDPRS